MHHVEEKDQVQNFNKINHNTIIHIETLGCRLNQIESESMASFFSSFNFSVQMESVTAKTESNQNVLICIINTCTVTQKAEQKARRIIRLLLNKYPKALVIVTGCYAQLNPNQINEIDERIITIGGQIKSRIKKIPQILNDFFNNDNWNPLEFKNLIYENALSEPQKKAGFPENSFELSTSTFMSHSRASLKIQDGCNNNCSYCAIHIARGHSVSIPVEKAIERVIELEKKGINEVVITTINIGQYKSEYGGQPYNFAKLLKKLLEVTEKINFRISSLYPEIVDDEFCEVIKDKRVCPHFHISVQSGSDRILKLMNRVYKAEDVLTACKKLSSVKNNPFLACDIITGFPGETDEDFEQTLELCEKCNFTWIHAFPYSERPGTPAAAMKNKVPQLISGQRAEKLNEFAVKNKIKYINDCKNQKYSAILETLRKPQYIYHAVTENFLHCEIKVLPEEKEIPQGTKLTVMIDSPLIDKIQKGGEIEASAHIIKNS